MSIKRWIALAVALMGLVLLMALVVRANPPGQRPDKKPAAKPPA